MQLRPPSAMRPLIEELEARILHSADLAPGVSLDPGQTDCAEVRLLDDEASAEENRPGTEVVFVDTGVDGWQTLIADIEAGREAGDLEIILLDPSRDGVEQIAEHLAGRQGIEAIHLISHGGPGELKLGSTTLNAVTLADHHADALNGIASSLAEDADLLIYGCDVAAGLEGQSFVDALGRLTGADVAASIDKTGSTQLGGNWVFEYYRGFIQAPVLFSKVGISGWKGLLADPTLAWNTFQGGATTDTSLTIVVDASGNQFVGGYLGSDAAVWKLDSNGALLWTVTLGGTSNDRINGITLDASGNIYVTGYSSAAWGTPVRAFGGGDDAFVAKLNSGGAVTWNTFLGAGGNDSGYGIDVDASGNVHVSGNSTEAWGSPLRAFTVSGTNADGFVAKLNSSGALTWNSFLGGTGSDGLRGLTLDASGNIFVAGFSDAAWGSPVDAYSSSYDALAAKLTSAGALSWHGFYGGAGSEFAEGLVLDGGGNLVLGGYGGATWGTPVQGYSGNLDALAIKVNGSGALVWNTFAGSVNSDVAYDIAIDASDNVYLTGFSGATWGSPARAYSASNDAFAMKLSSAGARAWNTFLGGAGSDAGNAIATDDSGNVYVAGNSNATWGTPLLAYTSNGDGFVAKLEGPVANAAPTITSNGGGATASISVAEYTTAVTTVTATDTDVPVQTLTYSISGGTDAAKFAINSATGALTFVATPLHQNPTDVGGNNIYDVTIQVSDGNGGTDSQAIAVTVTDVANTLSVTTISDDNDAGIVAGNAAHTYAWLSANKGADGHISLREAIIAANNTTGANTINFNIDGTGIHTINLAMLLPSISEAVTIDATTDDSFAANGNRPAIVLNGNNTVQDGFQLYTNSGGSTIRGFVIQNFTQDGIDIASSNGNTIVGNWIGLNNAGTGAAGNQQGINLWNSNNNIIGGSTAADRNVISANSGPGININTDNGTSTGNQIRGNYIGTDASGTAAVGNGNQGIYVNAANNTIGGTTAGQGNVISGTTNWSGITLQTNASGTLVAGNLIGLNAAGTAALGNAGPGIDIYSANNTIGGVTAAARNVISGNSHAGLFISGASATGNVVIGNYIGTNAAGTGDVNGTTKVDGRSGVVILNGASNNRIGTNADGVNDAAERNVISGNNWFGLEFQGSGTTNNVAQGNYIGTDVTGLVALGNSNGGVSFWNGVTGNLLGSGLTGAGNVISGNETGVLLANNVSANKVQGNLIGLGADGSTAVGNTGVGVYFYNGASLLPVTGNLIGTDADGSNDAGERNVISGNYRGVAMRDAEVTGNTLSGNYIGTDVSGLLDRGNTLEGLYLYSGAHANTLGGSGTTQGNVISGNDGNGVLIDGETSDGNILRGNKIGVNASGSAALGNAGNGIQITGGADGTLIGGTGANDGNWIADSGFVGIEVNGASTSTVIQGNRIGTDLSGTANWGNQEEGVWLHGGASNTLVGGAAATAANTIAFNGNGGTWTAGISVWDVGSTGNAILGNSLYGNRDLGIEINNDGISLNDAGDSDTGPNDLQNYPVLSSAIRTDTQLFVSGSLEGVANGHYRIEFFANNAGDTSGHGEGQTYLGYVNVTADAGGNVAFSTTMTATVAAGSAISATATSSDAGFSVFGSTSEFAANEVAIDGGPANTVPAAQSVNEDASLVFSVANGNAVNVSDGMTGDARVQVTLSVSHGALTLAQLTGLTLVSGANGSASMVIDGLESDINAALNGMTYAPAADYHGADSLQVTTSLAADLLGLYTFDAGTAADSSAGTVHDGSFVGNATTTVDGTHGTVLSLDGSGDSVQIAGTFGNPANVTIGAWVNFTGVGRQELISLNDRVHIALDDGVAGVKGSVQTAPGVWSDLSSGQTLSGTGWHHIMYTYDDAADTHTLYIDGAPVATAVIAQSIDWAGATTSYIGQHPLGTNSLNGQVDDVRIYGRALSGTEVASIAAGVASDTDSVAIVVAPVADAPVAADDRLALNFDGVDDFVSIADSPSLTMTTALTMEAWVNPDVSANAYQMILNKEGEYEMAIAPDGSLFFAFGGGSDWGWHDTGTDIARNAWTHVALTYDAGVVSSYVNGVLVNTQTMTATAIGDAHASLDELRIGGRSNAPASQYFDGRINEVRVWNVVRSQAEIAAAMNSALTGAETGLAGYWPLTANTGATAEDASGNSNDGALTNGADWVGYRMNEDGVLNVAVPGVLGNDYDADGDALTAILVTTTAHGSLTLNADGSFTYTPDANWHGTDSFTYRVNDGTTDSGNATVSIVVDAVNDAPGGTNMTVSTPEDTAYTFAFADFGFTDAADSPANSPLSVTIATLPLAGSLTLSGVAVTAGQSIILADIVAGNLKFTPAANGNGVGYASFTFQVRDDAGTANGGADTDPTPNTLTIDVTPVNDAPTLISSSPLNGMNEDQTNHTGTLVSQLIALSFSDVDAGSLKGIAITAVDNSHGLWEYTLNGTDWLALGSPAAGTARLLASDATTAIRFMPDPDYNGSSGLMMYKAWDQTSGVAGGLADATVSGGATAFSLTSNGTSAGVTAVNDAPVNTLPGAQVTAINAALVLSLAGGNAVQVSDVDAATLQVSLTVNHGTITLSRTTGLLFGSGDGSADATMTFTGSASDINAALDGMTFTPANAYQGAATLDVVTSDLGSSGAGGTLTDSDTVHIQVGAARFQQGVDGYAGTEDTWVSTASPGTNHGGETTVVADDDSGSDAALLRFDNLFGGGAGQIPVGSTIDSVTLSIYVTDRDEHDSITLHRMLSAWNEASTYASLVSGVQADNSEAESSSLLSFSSGTSGWNTLSGAALTAAVQAWADGETNHGFAFLSNNADLWTFASSENATVSLRPYLSINYTPPQAPVVTTSGGNASYTENAAAVAVDPGLTLTDADSTQLTGASVQIAVNYSNGHDQLNFLNQNGISGVWSAATGTLTLSGLASVADYQTALRSITFVNDSENPNTLTRTVEFTVSDAYVSSATVTRDVNVVAVNDAPVAVADSYTVAEDGTLTIAAPGVMANDTDPEGASLITAASKLPDHAATFNFTTAGNIVYTPVANFVGTDTFTYQVGDGSLWSGLVTVTITVTPANDAPVLVDTALAVSQNEDLGIVIRVADLVGGVSDVDGNPLGIALTGVDATHGVWSYSLNAGATWTAVGSVDASQSLLLPDDGGNALLYFAPAADWNGALPAALALRGWDQSSGSAGLKVDTSANGGGSAFSSASDTVSLTINPVNDAPAGAVTIDGSAVENQTLSVNTTALTDADGLGGFSYQWLRGGVAIAGATADSYTLGDADVGAQISVAVSYTDGHGTAESVTSSSVGPVANVNDAPGGSVTIDGSAIEDQTLSANTSTLSDTEGLGAYSYQWLRSGVAIAGATASTFTLSDADVGTQISLAVSYTDGQGTAESVTSVAVGPVTNINDTPAGTVSIDGSATEDQTLTANTSTLADDDGLGGLGYQWLRDGVAITGATASTYTLGDADVGAQIRVTVSYTDGHGTAESVTSLAVGPVTNVNDTPALVNPLVNQAAIEDAPFSYAFDLATFSDADGDSLTYTTSALPAWLSFDGATRTFTGTPTNADVGTLTVVVTADDGHGGTVSDSFDLVVSNTNDAPTVANPLVDQVATEDAAFSYTFDVGSFNDVDTGDSLSYSTSALPAWLSFDGATRTFTGTPTNADVGTITVVVTADDGHGGTVSDSFDIVVGNTNDAPIVVMPIVDQTAIEDAPFSYTFDLAAFSDADGDSLTYTTSALPAWLSFDGATRTFTGTPANADVGTITVVITADDGHGGTVSDSFDLVVANTNDAPTTIPVVLGAINEDGNRLITQADLLTGAQDVDGDALVASGLTLTSGNGSLVDHGNGTWTFVPNADWHGGVTFDYVISDGVATIASSASLMVASVNDAPVIVSDGGGIAATIDLPENSLTATTVTGLDADADLLNYRIVGGADAGRFTLDAATGELRFVSTPDFETPDDADGDHVYEVVVTAEDGQGGTVSQSLTINLLDLSDTAVGAATDDDPAPNRLDENAVAGSPVGISARANDADVADTLIYSLDNDAGGRFVIDASTGVVSVAASANLDYELAAQHDLLIRVTSSDGSFSTLALTVELNNLNDTSPSLAAPSFTLLQGSTLSLSPESIRALDPDGLSELAFTLSNVEAGSFELVSAPGVPITVFSEAALTSGQVRFVHDGSTHTPGFEISVSDGVFTSGPISALVRFSLIDIPDIEPPTPVTPDDTSAPEIDAADDPVPVQTPDNSVRDSIAERLRDDLAETAQEVPQVRVLTAARAVDIVVATVRSDGDSGSAGVGILEQFRLQLARIVQANIDGAQGETSFDLPEGFFEQQKDERFAFDVVMDGARLAGLTFSVGAVWWVMRVGGLMASLFASVPAWRQLDPLPILRNKDELHDAGKWLEEDVVADAGSSESEENLRNWRDNEVAVR